MNKTIYRTVWRSQEIEFNVSNFDLISALNKLEGEDL